MIAKGSGESGEALADAADMVAGPAAVHAEGTRLGAAMAIEPGGTDCGEGEMVVSSSRDTSQPGNLSSPPQ